MRVVATRNSSREGPDFVAYVGLADELHALAGEADVIINALPLTPDTEGILDKAFFDAALKPMGALLAQGARPIRYDIVSEGSRVVLMWDGEGEMNNGEPYHNSYCWVLEVAEGQITRIKAYLDTALVDALFAQA